MTVQGGFWRPGSSDCVLTVSVSTVGQHQLPENLELTAWALTLAPYLTCMTGAGHLCVPRLHVQIKHCLAMVLVVYYLGSYMSKGLGPTMC